MPTGGTRARPVWFVAVATGAATALLGMVTGVAAVAACWLPVSGGSGGAAPALRAGVLTFLAALHAGITVDGLPTAFVPLGMTLAVAALAWRAGRALAEAAQHERRPGRLIALAAAQAATFAAVCGVAAPPARLGTSSVAALPATATAFLLFAVSGGVAFAGSSALADLPVPGRLAVLAPAARAAAAATAVVLAAGALLVAGSLVVHHARVMELSRQVGGGWSGLPVLLLGLLAVPNAAIAGSSYLAGPGFAVGSGSHVSLFTTAHGTLPAFPLLGAVPTGHGAGPAGWVLAAGTFVVAGAVVAWTVRRAGSVLARLRDAAAAALLTGLLLTVLAWQGGGAVGSGRLNAVGPSPWRTGSAVAAVLVVAACLATGVLIGVRAWRGRRADREAAPVVRLVPAAPSAQPLRQPAAQPPAQPSGEDELAG